MKTYQVRQGDLLLEQVAKLPVRLTKVADNVILRGLATGHAHKIVGGTVWKSKDTFYVKADVKTSLVHDEHHTIKLPKGKYVVTRQKEYTSANMAKLVVD